MSERPARASVLNWFSTRAHQAAWRPESPASSESHSTLVSAANRHSKNRRSADQPAFFPDLTTSHERCPVAIAPFHDDVAAVLGPIEAGCVICHAQPTPTHIIERKIL